MVTVNRIINLNSPKKMKTKKATSAWTIVEHSQSDTSIYDQNNRLICTKSIDDEDCTEDNQEELEAEVSKDFNLIVCAPEMLQLLKYLNACGGLGADKHSKIEELINFAGKG